MNNIRAWAAKKAGEKLEAYRFDMGPLGSEEVEVKVEYCGLCHSDISMLENDWGNSSYPLVPGHEIVGEITALGNHAKGLQVGQYVGIGWIKESCMFCASCIAGTPHLCAAAKATIVGHHGGVAERVRAHWAWATPLPAGLDIAVVAPLFCGGVTVFSPLIDFSVRPTDRVGIVGIGGLGHLAVQFAHAWGCEVTAFTSNNSKYEDVKKFGAHHVIPTYDAGAMAAIAGSLDFLLVTANVPLPWDALLSALSPKGTLHIVGVVLEDIPIQALQLISGQKTISGSSTGSPNHVTMMLDFCARHNISPQVENFPMSRVNDALDCLKKGEARYRIVLNADFA